MSDGQSVADIYERAQATASRLLGRFAQGVVTLTRVTRASADPATPWIPGAETTTSYALSATVRGVSKELVDGTAILATDLQVMAAVPGVEPALTDRIEIDGQSMTIVRIDQIPAAGLAVAYRMVVRA